MNIKLFLLVAAFSLLTAGFSFGQTMTGAPPSWFYTNTPMTYATTAQPNTGLANNDVVPLTIVPAVSSPSSDPLDIFCNSTMTFLCYSFMSNGAIAAPLMIAPKSGTTPATLFEVFCTSTISGAQPCFAVNSDGSYTFSGNSASYGSPGQVPPSFLLLNGGSGADAYLAETSAGLGAPTSSLSITTNTSGGIPDNYYITGCVTYLTSGGETPCQLPLAQVHTTTSTTHSWTFSSVAPSSPPSGIMPTGFNFYVTDCQGGTSNCPPSTSSYGTFASLMKKVNNGTLGSGTIGPFLTVNPCSGCAGMTPPTTDGTSNNYKGYWFVSTTSNGVPCFTPGISGAPPTGDCLFGTGGNALMFNQFSLRDQTIVSGIPDPTTGYTLPVVQSLPTCPGATTAGLAYSTSTHQFLCLTLDLVADQAASKTFNNSTSTLTFAVNNNSPTNTSVYTFKDFSGNSGSGKLLNIKGASGSALIPFEVDGANAGTVTAIVNNSAASPTADIMQFQLNGAVSAKVDSSGNFTAQGVKIGTGAVTTTSAGGTLTLQTVDSSSATGSVTVRAGNQTGTANASAGGLTLTGGNNASTNSGQSAGNVVINPGQETAGVAGGPVDGVLQISNAYTKSGTATANRLGCPGTGDRTVTSCSSNTINFLGVIVSVTNNSVLVQDRGIASIVLQSGGPTTAGDFACTASGSGSGVVDNGTGATQCTGGAGHTVGIIVQSGIANGSNVLVQLNHM